METPAQRMNKLTSRYVDGREGHTEKRRETIYNEILWLIEVEAGNSEFYNCVISLETIKRRTKLDKISIEDVEYLADKLKTDGFKVNIHTFIGGMPCGLYIEWKL